MAAVSEFVGVHPSATHPGVATLVLSRPPTNAMTRQVYREIAQAAGCSVRALQMAFRSFRGTDTNGSLAADSTG